MILLAVFSHIGISIFFWIIAYLARPRWQTIAEAIMIWVTVTAAKLIFAVPRPLTGGVCPTDYSFPSLHSAFAWGAATILTRINRKYVVFYIIGAFLISYSRIFLQCHTWVDIIAGAGVGIGVVLATERIFPGGTPHASRSSKKR